jgi:hypothetical protein
MLFCGEGISMQLAMSSPSICPSTAEKVILYIYFTCESLILLSAFAASVWVNDVFLNTSYGK